MRGAGVILMRNDNDEQRFLLLRGSYSGIWSFSKGRPEDKDNNNFFTTAIRETNEETGFILDQHYVLMPVGPVQFCKRLYWFGSMIKTEKPCISSEHDMACWFTISEIEKLKSNTGVRMWLKSKIENKK
jgi:8-oxo-dGTP pyrophosphatase MutT (NUDIX family)